MSGPMKLAAGMLVLAYLVLFYLTLTGKVPP